VNLATLHEQFFPLSGALPLQLRFRKGGIHVPQVSIRARLFPAVDLGAFVTVGHKRHAARLAASPVFHSLGEAISAAGETDKQRQSGAVRRDGGYQLAASAPLCALEKTNSNLAVPSSAATFTGVVFTKA